MRTFCLMLAVTAASAGVAAEPPASDYEIILEDLRGLGDRAATARYISYADVDKEDLVESRRVTSYMLNSVAALRVGSITRPVFIADGRIARFQAEWYAPTSALGLEAFLTAWERIAERNPLTCFETEVEVDGDLHTQFVVGGWIPLDWAQKMTSVTGSISPVIHFGHFLRSCERDGYYDLAGIGDRAETFAKLGIDDDLVTKLHADRAATVKRSGVANGKPRRIRVFQGVFGNAWVTYDVDELTPAKDAVRHPLSNILVDGVLGQAVEYDANEYVLIGRNGLPVWLITDAAGKRQSVVNVEVAVDYSDSSDTFDRQISPPFSCIRCHNDGGFNDFDDYQQTLMERGQFAYTPEHAVRIAETYRSDIVQGRLEFDKEIIDASTKLAAGVEWDILSMDVALMYRKYVLDDVTPEEASRVLRADVADVIGPVTTDPHLIALASGESINRDAWNSSLHLALINGAPNHEDHHRLSGRFPVHDSAVRSGDVPDPSGPVPSLSE